VLEFSTECGKLTQVVENQLDEIFQQQAAMWITLRKVDNTISSNS
jgi:hypothetical protein